ncbi:MAG: hypothetical protein DRJ18_01470 [Candidatus Methanomethylicota archaeon]|nr:MAG: hypothetical protein DRJ18_01470 [Candidatus Verstraetearchaeota archaeon]
MTESPLGRLVLLLSQSFSCRPSEILCISDPVEAFAWDVAFLSSVQEVESWRIPLSVGERIRMKRSRSEYRRWLSQFKKPY